nr:helix-turn-helix domain-containing protein [Devosia sp. YR412]
MPWSGPAQRSCDQVIALVSQHKRVPSRLLVHAGRGRNAASRARQLAMYLAHVIYGRTLAEIGHAFGRDRTTVSYACARIEDLRDDPCFDAEVCALEQRLETTMAAEAADHGL